MMSWEQFERQAKAAGLQPVRCTEHHWQLKGGPLLVNFYPFAKKGPIVYVAGTTGGYRGDIKAAIRATKQPPQLHGNRKDPRAKSYRTIKARLLSQDPRCWVCGCALSMESATIDHVVPRSRGGLDNANNLRLACEPCNQKRGNHMPELRKAPQ